MEDLEIKMEPPEDDIVVDNAEDQPKEAEGEIEPVPAQFVAGWGGKPLLVDHCHHFYVKNTQDTNINF